MCVRLRLGWFTRRRAAGHATSLVRRQSAWSRMACVIRARIARSSAEYTIAERTGQIVNPLALKPKSIIDSLSARFVYNTHHSIVSNLCEIESFTKNLAVLGFNRA